MQPRARRRPRDGGRRRAAAGPEKLHVFVVLKKGQEAPPLNKLKILFNKAMAQALGPGYYTEGVHAVDSLPRTASNKVMRRVLRDNLEKA